MTKSNKKKDICLSYIFQIFIIIKNKFSEVHKLLNKLQKNLTIIIIKF